MQTSNEKLEQTPAYQSVTEWLGTTAAARRHDRVTAEDTVVTVEASESAYEGLASEDSQKQTSHHPTHERTGSTTLRGSTDLDTLKAEYDHDRPDTILEEGHLTDETGEIPEQAYPSSPVLPLIACTTPTKLNRYERNITMCVRLVLVDACS